MAITKKAWHISNTNEPIIHFNPSNRGIFGPGIYTTTTFEKVKKHYFDQKSKRFNGRVYEFEVTLNNPIEGTDGIMKDGTPYYSLLQHYASEYGGEEGSIKAMEHAKHLGHDGIIRKSTDGTEIILPFDNKSVKIINNNVNMEELTMKNKQPLTEQDFISNGRKNWKFYKESLLTREEVLTGGKADAKTVDDIAAIHGVSKEEIDIELKKGLEVEREHTSDPLAAREIAMDHLVEDPKYYTKLLAAKLEEKQDCSPWKPGCKTQKGKSIIRAGWQWGATPNWAVGGPGTVSPSTADAPAADGGAAAVSTGRAMEEKTEVTTLPKDKLIANVVATAEQYLRAGEAAGLEGMTLEGHSFLMDNLSKLTPSQQERFNKLNSIMESKKNKGPIVSQGNPAQIQGNSTTRPAVQHHKTKKDYNRKDTSWKRFDESENKSKYFKNSYNILNKSKKV